MRDQRIRLKVKIRSLADEARTIRKEERKPHKDMDDVGYSDERRGLWIHRTGLVRREARHALLAYGFIRGRRYRQMEAECEIEPDWRAVQRLVAKYGLPAKTWRISWDLGRGERIQLKEALLKRFKEWKWIARNATE